MKSLVSNHNHNTSGHSLRKFRNTKYFQDQRGYETDYMKRRNEFAGSTPQQKKEKNKFDDQVNEYLRKAGSGLSESVVAADDNQNLDYASEVESKIKSLEAKHLASSVIFQKLSHCHSELMNLHNTKIPSNNNTFDKANITTRSIDIGTRPTTQRQFKSQSNLTIISTPYKSPSFQNKKSAKSLQIHSKQAFFNQANNGDTISKILESSLDRLDEEDIAENISIKEKILDSLNEPHHEHEEFNNVHMNGIDEQEEYQRHCARNLQSEINNQGNQIRNKLDESYDNAMQNVDESDAYSISQKLILLGSNIKPKTPLKHDSSYFLSPNLRSSADKTKRQEGNNKIYANGQQSQNQNQNQHYKLNYLSPDSSQKKQAPLLNKNLKNDKFKAQQLIGQVSGQQIKSPSAQQSQKQVRQKTPEKNIPQTSRGTNAQNNANDESAQKQQRSPSQQKNGQQSSSKKKVEKYYLQQVERQNDLVQQQQKQIIQYQQQLQQQTLEFQLFMQEQQLLSQQNYFQQQQQLMNQQRSSASMLLQQPFLPLQLLGASANPLFSFNHLNSPLVMSAANPTQSAAFMPQVHPPIIINNNIQKTNEEEQNNLNNNNTTNINNLNGSMNSQQQQAAYLTSNKTHSLQIPSYEKNGDETLTPAGQQGTADQSQIERQTEQIFKNNNNSNSFAGNFAKKSSSQRRKWDIGQKTCTQSELSADEDYLTQYNREIKQPRQFEYSSQLYLPPQQNMHQNQPHLVQYKKPVKFDIFWEKDEIEQENKENQRNNSNKRVNNTNGPEDNKLESLIQKQFKNVTDQPDNQTNPQNNNRTLQDIFVSKKTDLQRKLEYEKNAQHQVLSYRNQSPDLSKEDLIQIRRDLLKPKSQQVMQSINFDSHNQSHQQSHFQSQFSHISQGFPTNSLASQSQVNPSISTAQATQKPQIQTSTISLAQPTVNLNVVPLSTPNATSSQLNNLGSIQKQVITQPQQINIQLNTQPQAGSLQKPYIQTQPINTQQKIGNLNNLPQQQTQQAQQNFQHVPLSVNQYATNTQQQNQLYSQQPSGGIQLVQQQPQQILSQPNQPQQNTMIQINPQNPIQIQSQFQQPFIPLHQPYQLNQNPPVNQIQQYHRITSN
ncbi:hypothetical protein TTHERM_00105650 (macronuclear) [Tetrahymena thermophila SB210]|uniref:Uncharacterized protein n=1 Tax=Tetrahymena thermophila (strain SB210) TaxID=312017 RepID=Q234D3_TETTS|nr:hypothetical protein TTHERM_00105650 [Tetrahymena thermophila SB210]EAR92070.2 hypothetical protein TTHERM_00105650 [Tetrahymena thermophila SB210]|eukprot:XP_001012315.2 hypothetical protein TTHERM_00105650 [Tetrahymena thermophila SB210]